MVSPVIHSMEILAPDKEVPSVSHGKTPKRTAVFCESNANHTTDICILLLILFFFFQLLTA